VSTATIRRVMPSDGGLLRDLVLACPPLDVHTPYTYWVQSAYFSSQCFIAERAGEPVGFLTSVGSGSRILLWQIGVLPEARSQGIALDLVRAMVSWARSHGADSFDVSIAPDNAASLALFERCAADVNGRLERRSAIDLRDSRDPDFREVEVIYCFHLGPSTD